MPIVQRAALVTVSLVVGARGQGLTCETPKDCEVGNADAVDYVYTRAANHPSVFIITEKAPTRATYTMFRCLAEVVS